MFRRSEDEDEDECWCDHHCAEEDEESEESDWTEHHRNRDLHTGYAYHGAHDADLYRGTCSSNAYFYGSADSSEWTPTILRSGCPRSGDCRFCNLKGEVMTQLVAERHGIVWDEYIAHPELNRTCLQCFNKHVSVVPDHKVNDITQTVPCTVGFLAVGFTCL